MTQSTITVVENEYITVQYIPDKRIIYHIVHKPIGGQVLRDALSAGGNAMKQYGAHKWLSDDRNNGPLSQEDVQWGSTHWWAPMIAAGWKYWALVVPAEIVAAGSMSHTIDTLYEYGLRMMVFSKPEEAFEWLDKMKD